eukprot:scaffold29715_cov30-Tisochrysis_lutea.AAC.1
MACGVGVEGTEPTTHNTQHPQRSCVHTRARTCSKMCPWRRTAGRWHTHRTRRTRRLSPSGPLERSVLLPFLPVLH